MDSAPSKGDNIVVVQEVEVVHSQQPENFRSKNGQKERQRSTNQIGPNTFLADRPDWLSEGKGYQRVLSVDADAGIHEEKKMTLRSAFQMYPKAVMWSTLVSFAIIMEAYDKSLVSNFYALPSFRRAFGSRMSGTASTSAADYQIPPSWQISLQNGQVCGEIIGLLVHGIVTEQLGYQKTIVITMAWMCASVLASFLATSICVLLLSQCLSGLAWGILETMAATYAAEILPVALRGFLLSNINMCWLIGQLTGAAVVRAYLHEESHRAWRVPLAIQWAWAVPLLIVYCFAPESPWWLIRHQRRECAYKSLRSLTSSSFVGRTRAIAMMSKTNEAELRFDSAEPTFKRCFEGTNLRRTIIVSMVWITQAMCGSTLTGYAPYFYEQAGLSTNNAFNLTVGMYGMGIVGNMISWILLRYVGRRTLYLWGLSVSLITLVAGGIVSILPLKVSVSMWVSGSLVIAMTMFYDMTIGPVCYVLVAEIPSTRLRLKQVVIARIAYNLALVINNTVAPELLNPTAWAFKSRTCFVFAGTTLLCLIWAYLCLPETRKLAYIEIDILFEKHAPAKKFKELQQRLEGSGYFSVRTEERSHYMWHGSQGFA